MYECTVRRTKPSASRPSSRAFSVAGLQPQVTVDPVQKGVMRHTWADTALARSDLAFEPAVALEEGIAAEYRWLKENL